MVGAVSEESVMLEWCCPNASICDSLVISFSMVAKKVKCFYHHLQEAQRQVWRRVLSKISSNSMCFVLRHVNKNVLLICNFVT